MKWLFGGLMILFLGLQMQLWFGSGGFIHAWFLHEELKKKHNKTENLAKQNEFISEQIKNLKAGQDSMESLARQNFGMVKKDETFYRFVSSISDKV